MTFAAAASAISVLLELLVGRRAVAQHDDVAEEARLRRGVAVQRQLGGLEQVVGHAP